MEEVEVIDKEKILEKMQKLIALQSSPNQNEAELSAIMLKKMMTKYSIDINEISLITENKTSGVMEDLVQDKGHGDFEDWYLSLAVSVGKFYDVRTVTGHNTKPITKGDKTFYMSVKTLKYLGFELDVKVAREMLLYLQSSIRRENKTNSKDFYFGAVNSLDERLTKMKLEINAEHQTSTSLVIVKQDKIKEYMADKSYSRGRGLNTSHNYTPAYFSGVQYGKSVSLNNQIK